MTLFKQFTFSFVTFCLLLIWPVRTDLRGDEPTQHGLKIYGTVVDATQNISEEDFAKLDQAASKSEEEFERIFREISGKRQPPITNVTARSMGVTKKVVSNSEGTFMFTDLPQGIYEVSAETPSQPTQQDGKRKVSTKKRIRVVETSGIVRLALHEELITVSGRITDANGQPIAGAKVIGTPVPVREVGLIDTVSTVSGVDGSYELKGFEPLNLYRVAGYLNGGSLNAPGALYTQVEIRVEAEGFKQAKENVPRVPLLTETQLVPGRRLWKALSKLAKTMDGGEKWQKMKERKLPSSHRNTITDVDIVLDHPRSDTHSDTEE